ncbi:MAG: pyridoxamine 5'-phosphate oxidase family protein [Chloroflexi bacterium]|nr:pyridoxamine 5'-phosphate oxidase family protein [Chloroflexota bacterium]
MVKLSEEVKAIISEFGAVSIATASKAGIPHVSPRGTFRILPDVRVLDDEHVVFVNMGTRRVEANLKENPQLFAVIMHRSSLKGCRIWGKAEVLDSGALFDAISAEFEPRGVKVYAVVKVTVEEVGAWLLR